ncbi:MAG TPA: hypothetical protein VI756_21325 [Blastocatellia bacterium]
MTGIRYTLVADGPSDKALIPILTWLLRQHNPGTPIQPTWADLSRVPQKPRSLIDKIRQSIDLYPSDILFVHRDAENQAREFRVREIKDALADLIPKPRSLRVVPVRMQEAWLLFDETAIRQAVGNPNGRVLLTLPQLHRVEGLPDPKQVLHQLIKLASGLNRRRLKKLSLSSCAIRVADYIGDFSPLRSLAAFQALETEVILLAQNAALIEDED